MPRKAPSHKLQLGAVVDHLTPAQRDRILNTIRTEINHFYPNSTASRIKRAEERLYDMDLILNLKMGSYGWAYYATNTVEIANHCKGTDQWEDTLLHEIAHHLNHVIHGCDGHGKNWKRIAAAIGARPVRVGPALAKEISEAVRGVEYTCKDCGYVFVRSRRWSSYRYHRECKNKTHGGSLKLTKHPHLAQIRAEGF